MLNKKYGYVKDGNIFYAPSTFKVRIVHKDTYIDPETGEEKEYEYYEYYIEQHPELHPENYANAYPDPYYLIEDVVPPCDEYHRAIHKIWIFDEERKVCVHEYEIVDRQFTRDDYDKAMENHITNTRNKRGYTTREPSAYATSNVPRFKQDAIDWQNFLDEVMLYALDIINKVESGEPAPSLQEFKDNLPQCHWMEE